MFKKILLGLLLLFVIIQFIRPKRNISTTKSENDISVAYNVPTEVSIILQTSCNDCHSNNTNYPWYSNIQPIAWWLNNHIVDGKRHLNFSEFKAYRIGKQYKKLEEINDEVKDNGMPLESYTKIHKNAILTDAQKQTLANWATAIRDSIKANYPEDSLKRPQRPQQAEKK